MYQILKSINETTKIAEKDNKIYILKKTEPSEADMYKKLMQLNHKNIIRIYELVAIDGFFYAAEEYCPGETLENYLKKSGNLSDEKVKDIALQLCSGLETLHAVGIIHRDINPSNIMIYEDGTIKIIDFGISRLKKPFKNADTQLLGTHGYAPPEQYGFAQTGEEADIYSLGVLINYMKTGSLPSENLASGAFTKIINKCIQVDKNYRYKSAALLAADIERKLKINSFIRTIPGFRKGVWWHILIAVIYYAFCIITIIAQSKTGDIRAEIKIDIGFFLILLAPVPVIFNVGNWCEKLSFTRNMTKLSKFITRAVFSFIIFLVGSLFFV